MERLGEYAQEESPTKETRNLPRDPIPGDVTTNSSESVKSLLENWNGVCKEREWKDSESPKRAKSDPNGKVSNQKKG